MPGNCLIAGLAGILANIERISLSFRNIAPITPSQDEYCYSTLAVAKDAMPLVLKKMLNLPGVSITHNSAVGRTSFASWMQLSEKVMQVVNNGMLAPSFGDIDVKKRHHINEQSTVLVGVMRLVAQKRPLLFLNCVNELRNRIPHLIVFLLGDGPLKLDVVEHIVKLDLQDIVTLVGSYQTPADYLSIADLLLHTAEFEGFPNVLLEAQALGCPVVATDVGGTSEVFSDELKALCLPVNNTIFALSDKVIEVLKPENKATYKAHCSGVLNRFTLEALANETIKACIRAEE
jgi:glycosyltransferase involved in cell wall biosynthesis